ncbi:hypothetical protein ACFO6R_03205 [Eubacterium multiforme]|uniref:Cellulose synthase/poly-beta-1,6-N-acetylglucosamine synthase-like glycosyltransferase n=1 Tax=Eubacterium multiforme TaxID=83339 RepID=A0ABT9UNL9_9FIRM|nr:hypothetical protein [Eubacterium multiforme]MDQ0148235.1 cellulose synthase/poly-beta-1,6-N-acetylglucosamine synthase-like glycosyltransferase [Eubacterium multiforme]
MELIARGVPESFLFVYAVCILTNTKIDKKRFFMSSILLALIGFFIRLFPISYGIHTILNIVVLVILSTYIVKINILESIKASIIICIIMFVCEGINMLLIQVLHGNDIAQILTNPALKTIYGIPSLIMTMILVLIIKFIMNKKEE